MNLATIASYDPEPGETGLEHFGTNADTVVALVRLDGQEMSSALPEPVPSCP